MDTNSKMMPTSKKRGIFLDDRVGKQKRCAPDRGCLSEAKTGVKIVERNKGWLIANPCFFLAEALNYLFKAVATSTAQATVQPTIGLLPMPRNPIISTCAGTDEEPAN